MASCVPADRERAVKEVAQVYERIKVQQPLLQCPSLPPSATTQLAQSLLGEALRALNVALSVMKQQPPAPAAAAASPVTPRRRSVVKPELPELSPLSPASADSEATATTATRAKKRSRSSVMEGQKSSSWVDFTRVPYEDGYEWRKYGEKKINGTSYTRSYFRCTYKDDTGCMATKHIQQKDNNDPPMFQVTYNNKHTCNNCTTGSNSSNRENGHAAAMVKQEPLPVLLPPLVEASDDAIRFDQSPPCQQQEPSLLFPMSAMQQFCGTAGIDDCHGGGIPSTSSSCISGESCDEYYYAEDIMGMAAEGEASAGDDPFYDFELYLLCHSFKDY